MLEIREWGLNMSSLEDVFVSTVMDSEANAESK
jgi:hypothetical protein